MELAHPTQRPAHLHGISRARRWFAPALLAASDILGRNPAPQAPPQSSTPQLACVKRRELFHLALAAGCFFLLRLVIAAVSGWNLADEAWMLQVTYRTSQGDLLYRDVNYSVLPFSIYACRAACILFGYGALTIKALSAAINICSSILCHRFLAGLGQRVNPWHLGVWMLLLALPKYTLIYSDLAAAAALGAGWTLTRWRNFPSARRAAAIGICLGLAVSAKYTNGAYVSLACAVIMLALPAATWRVRLLHLIITAASAVIVVGLFLIPLLLNGTFGDMVAECFGDKPGYVQRAGVNFFDGFPMLLANLRKLPTFDAAVFVGACLTFPLTLLAAATAIIALVRRPCWQLLMAFVLAAAVLASVYPRADEYHLVQGFAGTLVLLILAVSALPKSVARAAKRVSAVAGGLFLALVLADTGGRLVSSKYQYTGLPHLRGILFPKAEAAAMITLARELRRAPQPVFILGPESSGCTLISGIKPSSSYDYPLANTLTPAGEADLIARIRDGRIPTVLFRLWFNGPLTPERLRDVVVNECPLEQTIWLYEFRRSPATKPAPQPDAPPHPAASSQIHPG